MRQDEVQGVIASDLKNAKATQDARPSLISDNQAANKVINFDVKNGQAAHEAAPVSKNDNPGAIRAIASDIQSGQDAAQGFKSGDTQKLPSLISDNQAANKVINFDVKNGQAAHEAAPVSKNDNPGAIRAIVSDIKTGQDVAQGFKSGDTQKKIADTVPILKSDSQKSNEHADDFAKKQLP